MRRWLTKRAAVDGPDTMYDALRRLECLGLSCAGAVAVGLALALLIAVLNVRDQSIWERIAPVASDALVFLGTVGEFAVGRKARGIQEELTRRSNDRLTNAEDRAADALRDVKYLRSPRTLVPERVAAAMAKFAGTRYDFAIQYNESEFASCVYFLNVALKRVGMIPVDWAGVGKAISIKGGPRIGLDVIPANNVRIVVDYPDQNALWPVATELASALSIEKVTAVPFPEPPNSFVSRNTNTIHILVGRKT